ncbi:MAG TPA: phosphatidylserine/phosphatidylglycerophosphate/cardiolipin synthase family protein [Steroidobacteraceae bacterium]|nr:phosphatidylserine/phosphatidylglycerophosphate/cardiolipin synthase family protein [Steroidobacteraceae bacterium]
MPDGNHAYAAMLAVIDAAAHSVRLESYIIRPQGPAELIRDALARALARGVQVQVLYDAFGSEGLPAGYFAGLSQQGAGVAVFSPARQLRLAFRNHRKLLVADESVAIVGGLNIAPEYQGDGVHRGWRDLALQIEGPIAHTLAQSFDAMYALASITPRALRDFRSRARRVPAPAGKVALYTSGPGWPHGRLRSALRRDLLAGRDICCMAAYFLPGRRIRRALRGCRRRGGRVRLLLAGPTDVPAARYAGENLYGVLLRYRAQLFEYQPQVLHAKLVVIDHIVYVGSCNLDRRSLDINYELLLRLDWPELAQEARVLFEAALLHSVPLPSDWPQHRHWWQRWRSRIAYWVLTRVDPLLARRKLRSLG